MITQQGSRTYKEPASLTRAFGHAQNLWPRVGPSLVVVLSTAGISHEQSMTSPSTGVSMRMVATCRRGMPHNPYLLQVQAVVSAQRGPLPRNP